MPNSQITKDLVEEKVSLEQSLTRLYVLAQDVNNAQLALWAEKELNGYNPTDDLPEYRKAKGLILKYNGINGSYQVKKQPLQLSWIRQEYRESLEQIELFEGIRYIAELAASNQTPVRDLSELAGEVLRNTGGQVQCFSITQTIPQSIYQKVCAEVKHKMLQALIELEKKYGNLDGLGIDVSNQKPTQLAADNDALNRMVLNITVPQEEHIQEKLPDKIAWNIIIPIITGVVGAVIGAVAIAFLGL